MLIKYCYCSTLVTYTGNEYPRHCNDFSKIRKPPADNGITIIRPDNGKPFPVYCRMDRFGGGWNRILYRNTHKMSFNLDWDAYKNGFGYLGGDGWLGLEKIHRLTKNKPATLLVHFREEKKYNYYYPQYKTFQVDSEATKYRLYIGNFTGDGGDSLSYSHNARFSTYDQDNDSSSSNCASSHRGGWWYHNCAQAKLTGEPYTSSTSDNYARWPSVGNDAVRYATMEIKISND